MDKDYVIKWLNFNRVNNYTIPKDIKEYIIKSTTFLDKHYDKVNLSQRIWHIRNNDYTVHCCNICGKPLNYMTVKARYPKCSHMSCISKQKQIKESEIQNYYDNRSNDEKDKLLNKIANIKLNPHSKLKKEHLEEYLIQKTSFLDKIYKDVSMSQRLWHVRNNNYSVINCEICGKPKKFCYSGSGVGYVVHKECFSQKVKITFAEKYPNKQFYENVIKKKTNKTIKLRYGVDNAIQIPGMRSKAENTQLLKYGNKSHSKSKRFISMIEDNFRNTTLKRIERAKQDIDYIGYNSIRCHELHCNVCNNNFYITTDQISGRLSHNSIVCTVCNPIKKEVYYSYGEREIRDFITSIYKDTILYNSRNVINPYELDIYLPEKNIAIEYNGAYWHSEKHKDKDYHKIKSDLCKEKGIHLIHIFDYQWIEKREILKSILRNFIKPELNFRIYARKCTIEKITSLKDINKFLQSNHLLGKIKVFSICYGLYNNGELISLITLKRLNTNENKYELSRYAIKMNTTIIGGGKKLLTNIINNENIEEIVTYNDNSVFKGSVYEKLGFKKIRTNKPNYVYYNLSSNEIIPKQLIRKSLLGIEFTTERDYANNHNLSRVYNAGNDVYEMTIK